MALFEPHRSLAEEVVGSDMPLRVVGHRRRNDFVAFGAVVYDLVLGRPCIPAAWTPSNGWALPGDALEVGVGTGINAALFPSDCSVTGVDFSSSMLEKARERIARKGVQNVRLLQMDAANMKFADDTFDIVYAPYVISVVPDPVAVTREMFRVCRPGGRIVILNHFRSKSRVGAWLERMIAPFTLYLGFKSDLDLPAFLVQADLKPISIEKVNVPRIWSLVICVKD
jgi:phosphatidylethanolamine/phosphatidyl-N-methylethanolamine N-methyltransferase